MSGGNDGAAAAPLRLVVMGVAGSGKSTLGRAVAEALGCRWVEGDDYHLPESQRKMREGIALTDDDRWPWLDQLGGLLGAAGEGGLVVGCSALKRRYRDRLREGAGGLRFVFVDIDREEAARRVASRPGHLFPASLVASQFEALESPVGEPGVVAVAATDPTGRQVDAVLRWLGRGGNDEKAPPTAAAR